MVQVHSDMTKEIKKSWEGKILFSAKSRHRSPF